MATALDHLTIVAPDLDAGAAFVERMLGVHPQAGGAHASMGTHNMLLSLGESSYLEVIAPDPSAPAPVRPRWFGLDALKPGDAPRLAAWVLRTDDIHACVTRASYEPGPVEAMSRGQLSWLITIPADGSLPLEGALPFLIQWPEGVHPARGLAPSGCALHRLDIHHEQARLLADGLASVGFAGPVAPGNGAGRGAVLRAHIETPNGLRAIGSTDEGHGTGRGGHP